MRQLKLITLLFFFIIKITYGQTNNDVTVPNLNDKYTDYVKQLESGKISIDYKDFRSSFIESEQYKIKTQNNTYDSLKKEVYAQIKNSDYQAVIQLTKAMLRIDYTSMFAHKYLQQTYKIIGDTINNRKYHDIEFGLLTSIINSGDGKSCETAWQVIQIEEEYFILNMIGAQLQAQRIAHSKNNVCDRMDVKTVDGDRTYYFGVNQVFVTHKKSLGN